MRRALLVAALALATPATAHATAFGELATRAAPGGATCVRASGEPGGLVSFGAARDNDAPRAFELLRADATGLHEGAAVPPIEPFGYCAQVALRPSGAGIAASLSVDADHERTSLKVVLRDGGTWGAPAEVLGDPDLAGTGALAAAVSDAGAAVVAAGDARDDGGLDVTVTRRAPGGGFGPAETLFRAKRIEGSAYVQGGVTAAGETVVAWSVRPGKTARRELWATVAAPGGAFHAPVRIGEPRGPFTLAVGDGGYAVLAFAAGKELRVAERSPGSDFGLATPVGVAGDPLLVLTTAAVRADGAAVVAWVGFMDGSVTAVTRPAPGAFRPAVRVARRVPLGIFASVLDLSLELGDEGQDLLAEFQQLFNIAGATFLSGDRALLGWSATTVRDGVWAMSPSAAVLPLAGGPAETHSVGNGLRDTSTVVPLVLADGTPAVAWAEEPELEGSSEVEPGRLHLAVEGVADAADPPAPRVRIGAPKRRVIGARDALELPVTCSAACDVRASAGNGAFDSTDSFTLPRGGSATVSLRPDVGPVARLDGAPVGVYVRYGAPGTRHPRSRTISVRVRRRPSAPLPKIRGVKTRRDGDDVVVTWETDRRADPDSFIVYAAAEPRGPALRGAEATGSGRRFRARIRDAAAARFVTVLTGSDAGLIRRTTVEIKP